MNYLNIRSFLNVGSNLTKFTKTKDSEIVFVDGENLLSLNIETEGVKKYNVGLINEIFYSKSLDAILCCTGSTVRAVSSDLSKEVVFMTPTEFDLNLLSVTANSSGTIICAGAELKKSLFEKDEDDSLIVFWDARYPQSPIGYYKESHSEDIISMSFKEGSDYLLMSGSLDGLVVIYDIREKSEDEAVIICVNSEDIVHRCGWLPGHNKIYCTTGSETLMTWSISGQDSADLDKAIIAMNDDHKFVVSCIESTGPSDIVALSLSEGYGDLFVDGRESHATIAVAADGINGADFINDGLSIVAFSDTNVYIYY